MPTAESLLSSFSPPYVDSCLSTRMHFLNAVLRSHGHRLARIKDRRRGVIKIRITMRLHSAIASILSGYTENLIRCPVDFVNTALLSRHSCYQSRPSLTCSVGAMSYSSCLKPPNRTMTTSCRSPALRTLQPRNLQDSKQRSLLD
jgi:hypothetical protein